MVAVSVVSVLLVCAAAAVALGIFFLGVALNDLEEGLDGINLRLQATQEELATAATTVPPSPAACRAYRSIVATGEATARTTFDWDVAERDFDRYKVLNRRNLAAFDRDLHRAIGYAQDPLRAHLVRARQSVTDGMAALRAAHEISGLRRGLVCRGWMGGACDSRRPPWRGLRGQARSLARPAGASSPLG
ncbi:MAG: hypothetical protein M5T61_00970 [Acidimicrobiia bacterium]|nr:hypothetical protein [Acidimicrobiia bacterium]